MVTLQSRTRCIGPTSSERALTALVGLHGERRERKKYLLCAEWRGGEGTGGW